MLFRDENHILENDMSRNKNKKVWIDLDNTPHVPFFKPIITEMERKNYSLLITARDCFQVCGLADLANIKYKRIGVHYGKHTILKIMGLFIRALQMLPTVLANRPDVAVSHGSRTQLFLAKLLRIPTIMIFDYEHSAGLLMIYPDHVIAPEVIPQKAKGRNKWRYYSYPGIKEDVYVPDFKPDPKIQDLLGIKSDDIIVTIRPPASEAHYRNPESDRLFSATIEMLAASEHVRMFILPRNNKQGDEIRAQWPELFSNGKIVIPPVVDGLNLMWHSDFVISGGGTMNREAAALGIPVYSIFRGKTGAVDKYLSENGRLTLLETDGDVRTKIMVKHRMKDMKFSADNRTAFSQIVSIIETVAQNN